MTTIRTPGVAVAALCVALGGCAMPWDRVVLPAHVAGVVESSEATDWVRNWCSKGEPVTYEYFAAHRSCVQIDGGFFLLHVDHAVSVPDGRALPSFDILVAASIAGQAHPAMSLDPVLAPEEIAQATHVRYLAVDFSFLRSVCPQLDPSEPPSPACLEILGRRLAKT